MLLGLPFAKAFGVMEKMTVTLPKNSAEAAHPVFHQATFAVAALPFYIIHSGGRVTRKISLHTLLTVSRLVRTLI
jgi:hypothetical protein